MKELFPLNTFQQDAVLKRLNELSGGVNAPSFEDIVDKDGHKRFIDGEIEIEEITGITKKYAKWSLSGSHLLIVVCISALNASVISGAVKICEVNVPDWVKNKIIPVYSGSLVAYKNLSWFATNWSNQSQGFSLTKSEGKILVNTATSVTLTADREVRIEFDLLIDNAEVVNS